MKISEVMLGAWRERAIYVCEERAIPSVIDGLKPSQRFLLTQGYKTAKNNFDKVIAVAGSISALGFHHGNASAEDALTSMAAYHSNNLPLFSGDGNFGNVLNPTPAAARYIFVKLQPWIDVLFKDSVFCEMHKDPDVLIPKYYLPIIPMVLINGIRGIATGYACNIPPHSPIDIVDWLISRAKNEEPNKILTPKFPYFSGNVVYHGDGKWELSGLYEKNGNTLIITEIPPSYTMESYSDILDKLVDKGIIDSYVNESRADKYYFKVKIKRGVNISDILKTFRLTSVFTNNITTISEHGKLQEWNNETGVYDILEFFYNFRLDIIKKRIKYEIKELEEKVTYLTGLHKFSKTVCDGKFSFPNDEKSFEEILIADFNIPKTHVKKVIESPIRAFTEKRVLNIAKDIKDAQKRIRELFSTTPEKEYIKDLEELKRAINDS